MHKMMVIGAGIVALLSSVAPVGALSPNECYALQKQIARSRQLTNTGGMALTREIQSLRHAEENTRTEMVRSGCNKKVNASKPECQAIVARVHAAAAERKAAEGSWRRSLQAGAAADVAVLTARYDAECLSAVRAPKDPQRTPIARRPRHETPTPDETAAAVNVMIGIGTLLGGTLNNRGPRGPSGHR